MSEDIEIINQNTRIEKIKKFFSNNFKKLIGLLLSILLLLFSYFGYQEYEKRKKLEIAETYNQITLKEITIENTNDIEQLVKIIKEKDPIYSALSLYFIIENDFTLASKYLRLVISGKGCDGFNYGVGFTNLEENDFVIPLTNDPNVGGFGQTETEIVLQSPARIYGYMVLCFFIILTQVTLILKKKQFEKVQAAEMNF